MSDDKLSVAQRREALVWFEQGVGWKATATMVGGNRRSFQQLYDRWKIHGEAVLMPRRTPRQFTAEFKREVVERFLAGESKPDLAAEYQLSSTRIIKQWAAIYREQGPAGLEPKRRGRPAQPADADLDEVALLRRENERLLAKVALLEKLQALRAAERDGS